MTGLRLPRPTGDAARLAEILQDAVDLLRDAKVPGPLDAEPPRPEPTLLQQCLDLCSAQGQVGSEPVRTIHHFACTGGTLFSKCLAAMPNVQLLSEVDPLSTAGRTADQRTFAPTDMITRLAEGTRPVPREALLELFHAQMQVTHAQVRRVGGYLVVRDHTHSHFCTNPDPGSRPSLREILAEKFELLSVVTVRDPVDSYLSLRRNDWVKFRPATFEEYCRRYIQFVERYRDCAMVRYEDLLSEPKTVMRDMCALLRLPYSDMFDSLFSVFRLTGDSGIGQIATTIERKHGASAGIEEIRDEVRAASAYPRLAAMLGYETRPLGEA